MNSSRELRQKRNDRIVELLSDGLSPRVVAARVGLSKRQVLRIKKQYDSVLQETVEASLDD